MSTEEPDASFRALTEEDLSNVFFHIQDENGCWTCQNAKDAKDELFDSWVRSKMIVGPNVSWSLPQRRNVCNMLWQDNRIVVQNSKSEEEQHYGRLHRQLRIARL